MMNLRFFSALGVSVLGLVALLGGAPSTQAATVSAGTLVKASGPAVYYFSTDGRRYAFPDQATYNSWYSDFSGVQNISDSELAQIPFGGVVTIRPGSRMVKITTDPRVYAVARGGTLHWVETETLAHALYGDAWNRMISDVPDAFFTNYRIQNKIAQASDFSPTNEQTTIPTVDADIRARMNTGTPPSTPTTTTPTIPATSTPNTPSTSTPSTPAASFEGRLDLLSSTPYNPGDTLTVIAYVTRGFADQITLAFGTSTATPSVCSSNPCRGEFLLPEVQTTSTYRVEAVFSVGQGASRVTVTSSKEVTLVPTPISPSLEMITPSESIYGTTYRVRVQTTGDISPQRTRIMVDGLLKRECTQRLVCEFSEVEAGLPGSRHTVYAVVIDANDRRFLSPTATFPVVQ